MHLQLVACSLLALPILVTSEGVGNNRLGNIDENDVRQMEEMEFAGKASTDARHTKIRDTLRTMYAALPKNADGKLGRQVVRYALHRYFVQQFGWFVRGLEPVRGAEYADLAHHNSSQLREWIPTYLQDIFELQQHQEGSDLEGLVVLAAALEDVVRFEAKERFRVAIGWHNMSHNASFDRAQAEEVITTYYVEFLRNNELEARRLTGQEPSEIDLAPKEQWLQNYHQWSEELPWIQGLLDTVASEQGGKQEFKFEDMLRVVNDINKLYYNINDKSCTELTAALHGMESKRAGRVQLKRFYSSSQGGFSFSEKKEYMRSLGLLDESDPKRPYVIITNYVTSRHNCFAPSDVYVICCRSECEDLMVKLEHQIGAATSPPSVIAEVVTGLASATVEAPRQLSIELLGRLSQIAELHGGIVPLHGRLFAQWMHHAFPLECVFPHESGAVNPQTASEWLNETGMSMHATEEELLKHMEDEACPLTGCPDDTELPWSTAEELLIWNQEVSSRGSRACGFMRRALFVIAALALSLFSGAQQLAGAGNQCAVAHIAQQPPCLAGLLLSIGYLTGLLNEGLFLCFIILSGLVVASRRVMPAPTFKKCVCEDPLLDKMV